MRKELLARIPDENLRAVTQKVFEVADRFADRRNSLDGDRRLSDVGRAETLASELAADFGPSFRLARQPIRAARAALEARKAKISLPPVDRSDTVGALERQEIRAHVRSLTLADRTKLLFDSATADKRILDAVLAAPAELSGLPLDRHSELLARRLRELYGADLEALRDEEAVIAEAESACEIAVRDMKATLDPKSDGRRFDQILNKAVVPWLINQGNTVVTVKIAADGSAEYPPATPEEIRAGKFFANLDDYRAAQAA